MRNFQMIYLPYIALNAKKVANRARTREFRPLTLYLVLIIFGNWKLSVQNYLKVCSGQISDQVKLRLA